MQPTLRRSPNPCSATWPGRQRWPTRLRRRIGLGERLMRRLRNIQRLRKGAFAVVTGQQVGLFGGPLLSLLKAASALSMAKQVEALGVECVPVFWMATEDHDLAEVNKALLLTQDFQQAPFTAPTTGTEGAPVAAIRFAEGTDRSSSAGGRVAGRLAGRRLPARQLPRG